MVQCPCYGMDGHPTEVVVLEKVLLVLDLLNCWRV